MKLIYLKECGKKCNFVDITIVRERIVVFYFKKVIFYLTIVCENIVKKAKIQTEPNIWSYQKVDRSNKIFKLQSKKPKLEKTLVKLVFLNQKKVSFSVHKSLLDANHQKSSLLYKYLGNSS